MLIASLTGVTKFFGGRRILHELDLTIDERARIGLVGANGAGKSTLLKLLAGQEEANAGQVTLRRGLRLAYLPQHIPALEATPLDVLRAARPDLAEVEDQLAACERDLATTDLRRIEQALARQERLLARFE